ncbi:MAG TPA: universal stress protein [Solirubrobacteraceae bacterium]|nr:universal stress protein [Solirubrobacteraceae bacterium]
MFQRILIAWDGSELALRAFDYAIDIARRNDADLVALSIANSPANAETAEDREESTRAARRYLEQSFEEVRDRAERAGVAVEHAITSGSDPTRALAAYAHEHGFDLIVCGHHHSRRAGRLLLRGVAHDLIETTEIPLLVVGDDRG